MRIKPEQLKSKLSEQLESLYFVFGAEILLIEQSLTQIRQAAKTQGFDEKISFDIDANFDWNIIADEIASASLFCPKRIVECRLKSGKIGVKGSKSLSEIGTKLQKDVLLIISVGKLDKSQQNSKWFKTLEKNGGVIQHWEIKNENLVGWIANHMAGLGLIANKEVSEAIAACTEGNLLAAMQEIQKLKMAYPDGKINAEQYLPQIEQQSHYSVYALVDAALLGNYQQTLKIYTRLSGYNTTPIFLSSYLYKELKNIIKMSIELQKRQPIATILQNHFVWNSRKEAIGSVLKRHSYQRLQKMLLLLGRIDRSIKGMDNLHGLDELRTLLLTLSGQYDGLNN